MEWIIQILLQSVAVFLAARLLSFVEVKNFTTAIIVALGISIVGAGVGFVLGIFNIMTFGVFGLILALVGYVVTVMIVDHFLDDFKVGGIINVLIFGLVAWAIGTGLNYVVGMIF